MLKFAKTLSVPLGLGLLLFSACNPKKVLDAKVFVTTHGKTTSMSTEDLLWNQGLIKRNYLHRPCSDNGCNLELPIKYNCDLSGLIDGKPPGIWPYRYQVDDGSWIWATDSSAPSFTLVTWNYQNAEFKAYPGYDIWVNGGYDGNPIEFSILNNARSFADLNLLREVGVQFDHWAPNPGWWSFKKQYTLGDFQDIQGNFQATLDYFSAPPNHTNTVYVTADLRLAYFDPGGNKVRMELVGVIICNPNNYDLNGNPNDSIYWQGFTDANHLENIGGIPSARILLQGTKLGIPALDSSGYKNIVINYRALIEKFMPPPPPGYTHNDAVIIGWDLYSDTRGYDIGFRLKNVNMYGMH
jgi:hypothetical protein